MPLLAKLSHQTLVICYVLQVGAQAITELGNAKTDNLTNYLVFEGSQNLYRNHTISSQ